MLSTSPKSQLTPTTDQTPTHWFRRYFRRLMWAVLSVMFLLSGLNVFWSSLPQQILSWNGIDPGIRVTRYDSENWSGPPVEEIVVDRLQLYRPDSDILQGDSFSLAMSGYLFNAFDGQCQFELQSDDGSTVRIDNKTVISDPGYHGLRKKHASVHLSQGWHKLDINYFNGTSAAGFELKWQSPGRSLAVIDWSVMFGEILPKSTHLILRIILFLLSWKFILSISLSAIIGLLVLSRFLSWNVLFPDSIQRQYMIPAVVSGILLYGLFWSIYHMPEYTTVPKGFSCRFIQGQLTDQETTAKFTSNANFNSETHTFYRFTDRQVELTGWLHIEQPGEYEFQLYADDSADMIIHNESLLTSRAELHRRSPVTAKISLIEGFHQIIINYENKGSPAVLEFKWKPPGSKRFHHIPSRRIFQVIPSSSEKQESARHYLTTIFFRVTLFGFLCLIFSWSWLKSHRHRRYLTQLTVSVFALLFLNQAIRLNHDHQIGLRWFTQQNLAVRGTISLIILLYGLNVLGYLINHWIRWLRRHSLITLATGFMALLSTVAAQYFLTGTDSANRFLGALFYAIACLIIFTCGLRPIPARLRSQQAVTGTGRRILFLLGSLIILAGAVVFRFYRLHEMPPGLWWDEAQTGRVVQSILEGNFPPVYDLRINAGSVASYLNAAWCWLVNTTSPWGLRSYTAAIGVLTVGVSWWFFRQLFSTWWSLTGVALVAGLRWLFTINRTAMATIDETILLTFAVLALYLKAIRTRAFRYYISTGLLLGLAMHLHTGARVLPIIIGADLVVQFWKQPRKFIRSTGLRAGLLVLCAIIVFAPMATHILKHTDDYMLRSKQTLLSTEYPGWYPVGPYLNNVRYYLEAYVLYGDWHPRHNYAQTPQLPYLLSLCAVLGACLSLSRFRKDRWHRLLVSGFCLISLQGVLTVHGNGPNLNRIAENIPIVMAWSVYGLEFIVRGIRQLFRKRFGVVLSSIFVIAVVGLSWGQAAHIYFNKYLPWKALAEVYGFQPEVTEMAALSRSILDKDSEVEVWAMYASGDPFHYIAGTDERMHNLNEQTCPREKNGNPMVIIVPSHIKGLIDLVSSRFPEAEKTMIPYSLNPDHDLLVMFRIE